MSGYHEPGQAHSLDQRRHRRRSGRVRGRRRRRLSAQRRIRASPPAGATPSRTRSVPDPAAPSGRTACTSTPRAERRRTGAPGGLRHLQQEAATIPRSRGRVQQPRRPGSSGLCPDDQGAGTPTTPRCRIATCAGGMTGREPLPAARAAPAPPAEQLRGPAEKQRDGDVHAWTTQAVRPLQPARPVLAGLRPAPEPRQWDHLAADGNIKMFGPSLDTTGSSTGPGTLAVLDACNKQVAPPRSGTPGPNSSLVDQGRSTLCPGRPSASTRPTASRMRILSCNGDCRPQR